MRTYVILKEKARQFNADAEIQGLLAEIAVDDPDLDALTATYSKENARRLGERVFDRQQIGAHRLQMERLDQLTIDLLLGVRG